MRVVTYKDKRFFQRLENEKDNIIEAVMFFTDKFMVVKLARKQIYCFVKGGLFN